MRAVSLEVGAEAAARIGRYFGIQISGDTLLRVLRQIPELDLPAPRVVGIDDWAFKKGCRYGTLVVDLERHCPIDLLPDRRAETVTQWLEQHPSITIITRDRSQEYAQAATQGAPQALQIADRWHLLRNLGDALQPVLERYATRLRRWTIPEPSASILQAVDVPPRPASRHVRQLWTMRQKTRRERYEQIHQLHRQGWTQVTIARQLGICRKTVRRYLTAEALPGYRPRHRTSRLDPYKAYLLLRWNEGCHNAAQLAREIRIQGYPGCVTQVRDYVARLRQAQNSRALPTATPLPATLTTAPLTPRRVAYLLLRPADENDAAQQLFLKDFFLLIPELRAPVECFRAFAAMVRERQSAAFDKWLRQALQSECVSLKKFARGLQKDEAAVRAALDMPWSNGQSEGQINRLKLIKRQMYGRANFDLLRLRVLRPP